MLVVEHAVGNIIVYAYAGAVEIAESIDEAIECKVACVRGVENVATELEAGVLQAELCKQGCRQVGLAGYLVHHHRLRHCPTRPYHRYAEEVGSKALALLWIGYAVVGQQDDEGIVPLWGLAEALDKASYAVVGSGHPRTC